MCFTKKYLKKYHFHFSENALKTYVRLFIALLVKISNQVPLIKHKNLDSIVKVFITLYLFYIKLKKHIKALFRHDKRDVMKMVTP